MSKHCVIKWDNLKLIYRHHVEERVKELLQLMFKTAVTYTLTCHKHFRISNYYCKDNNNVLLAGILYLDISQCLLPNFRLNIKNHTILTQALTYQ